MCRCRVNTTVNKRRRDSSTHCCIGPALLNLHDMYSSFSRKSFHFKGKKSKTSTKKISNKFFVLHVVGQLFIFLNSFIFAEMAPKILRALTLRVSHRTQLWGRRRRFEWLVPFLSADWLAELFRGVSNSRQEVKADVTSSLKGAHGVNTRLAI